MPGKYLPHADRWIFVAFMALLIWAPVPLGSNRAWAWSMLEIGIFTVAAMWVVLWGIGRVRAHRTFLHSAPALILLMLWLAWLGVQLCPLPASWVAVLSPAAARAYAGAGVPADAWLSITVGRYDTEVFFVKSLAYVIAFMLTLALCHTRARLRMLASVLIASGVLQAVFASFAHLTQSSYEIFNTAMRHSDTAIGTFVNRNHLAGYLEMTLAMGLGMMIATLRGGSARGWRQRLRDWLEWLISPRILLRLMLVIMVIALVMTRSRMGNAAFFSSMLASGVLALALSRHATRSMVILIVSLIVIDVFIVGTWFGMENLVKRYEHTTIARDEKPTGDSLEERVEPGLYALAIFKDYPVFGSGGGTFYTVFPAYRPKEIGAYFNHTHNDYVQLAGETGLIGTGMLGLLVLWTLFVALRTQYQRRDAMCRGVAFGVTMAIIALMIHSWVDFNLQIPANAFTFVVVLAMGWVAQSVERNDRGASDDEVVSDDDVSSARHSEE